MVLLGILIVGWLISLLCIVHLWVVRRARLLKRIAWSVALLVPYLGPLFYGALFEPLPAQPEHVRARENDYAGRVFDP